MNKILIIHTGGTIGMTRAADGYKPDGAYFRNAIFHMDSLKAEGMPEWDFIECDPLLDSSQMSVNDWIRRPARDRYDGLQRVCFVVHAGKSEQAGDPYRIPDPAL